MRIKKLTSLILVFFLVSQGAYAKTEVHYYVNPKDLISKKSRVNIYLNKEKLEFDIESHIKNDLTMVQIRPIYESFGLKLLWNGKDKTILGYNEDFQISLKLGDNIVQVNENKIFSKIKPYTLDGHTMVPLRVIAESLGAKIEWDGIRRNVYLEY